MQHLRDHDLKASNSFGLAATASHFWRIDTPDELPALVGLLAAQAPAGHSASDDAWPEPPLLLGGGSNLLITATIRRPVLQLAFRQVRVLREAGDQVWIEAQAGLPWHELVMWSLAQGLGGLENLALIPGSVGAAPVQNIGAYGVELRDVFDSLRCFDAALAWREARHQQVLSEQVWREMDLRACAFGYRDSVFKREPLHWITAVRLRLSRRPALKLDYGDIRLALEKRRVTMPEAMDVAEAVMAIRRARLPDPAQLGNAGSFFKNPQVTQTQAAALLAHHEGMPQWPGEHAGLVKLSAAWMIDRCGLKGYRQGDAAVHRDHALVLVNHGRATGEQILALARHVQDTVAARFGIWLEPEPAIISG